MAADAVAARRVVTRALARATAQAAQVVEVAREVQAANAVAAPANVVEPVAVTPKQKVLDAAREAYEAAVKVHAVAAKAEKDARNACAKRFDDDTYNAVVKATKEEHAAYEEVENARRRLRTIAALKRRADKAAEELADAQAAYDRAQLKKREEPDDFIYYGHIYSLFEECELARQKAKLANWYAVNLDAHERAKRERYEIDEEWDRFVLADIRDQKRIRFV